jgi:hypothetical protein
MAFGRDQAFLSHQFLLLAWVAEPQLVRAFRKRSVSPEVWGGGATKTCLQRLALLTLSRHANHQVGHLSCSAQDIRSKPWFGVETVAVGSGGTDAARK